VGVVAAGVHDRQGPALPLGRGLGGERQSGLLLDRQGVHVGAQGYDLAGLAALQHPDHAGAAHALADLEAQGAQFLGHQGRRADLLVPQLGMFVDVAPPGHGLGLDGLGGGGHLGGRGGGHGRRGR